MFVKVENSEVVEKLAALPKSYRFSDGSSTGNFNLLDSSIQVAEGYYPLVENKPTFNQKTQRLVLGSESIESSQVIHNYVVQDIPLSDLRSGRISEVDILLSDKLSLSQFTFDSQVFNFHQQAANDVTQLQTLLGLGAQFPSPFSWTQADGEEYSMNQVQFISFANTLAAHKLGLIGVAKAHVSAIKAISVAQEIVDYDITAGW